MNANERLRELIAAEKASQVTAQTAAAGWERLANAIIAGVPGLPVAPKTIPLITASLVAEGAAIAFVVGALGAMAIVATKPEQSRVPVAPAIAVLPKVAPERMSVGTVSTVAFGAIPSSRPSAGPPLALPQARVLPSATEVESIASGKSATSLNEELQLIARAKREIDSGQTHLARAALDEHRASFPNGILSAERDGLALLMACDETTFQDVQARVDLYAAKYPGTPILDRLRRSCDRSSGSAISK